MFVRMDLKPEPPVPPHYMLLQYYTIKLHTVTIHTILPPRYIPLHIVRLHSPYYNYVLVLCSAM